jgi:DNA-binding PadR family transcriptional regulator
LMGEPTPQRGGMSKRYYSITRSGVKALQENRAMQETAWKGVSEILKSTEEI